MILTAQILIVIIGTLGSILIEECFYCPKNMRMNYFIGVITGIMVTYTGMYPTPDETALSIAMVIIHFIFVSFFVAAAHYNQGGKF